MYERMHRISGMIVFYVVLLLIKNTKIQCGIILWKRCAFCMFVFYFDFFFDNLKCVIINIISDIQRSSHGFYSWRWLYCR